MRPSRPAGRHVLVVGAVALASTVLVVSPARAEGNAVVGIDGTTLVVTAAADGANRIGMYPDGSTVVVVDSLLPPTVGAACSPGVTPDRVVCPLVGLTSITVSLGPGDDRATASRLIPLPAAIDGGAGDDLIEGGNRTDTLVGGDGTDTVSYSLSPAGVSVSLNGIADDGRPGESDLVSADVERVVGSTHDDVLTGSPGPNTLSGLAGDDRINGGRGTDLLFAGEGTDTVSYQGRTGSVTVDLNGGAVSGEAGEDDTVFAQFERAIGGAGDDVLLGNALSNTLTGGPGADTMTGGTGTDCVSYAERRAPVTVTIGVDGASGEAAEGDSVADDVECVHGGAGADTVTGD
uniref:calcium-binding protein n=1 Tax=Nocardioides stalactiti TaxID=2755356 RepID=UPI001C7E5ECC